MTYQALYRKARPRTFDAVVGQAVSVRMISKAISEERLSSSLLLSGHYGCGKTTIARLIAAAVNCEYREDGSANPCGGSNPECMTCPGVLEGVANLGAVTEMDAASKGSIAAVRELIDSMDFKSSAKYKVYVIDEAHRLSKDAVSALLKTIEEPPPGVVIIMATTEPNRIDKVMRSRLTHFPLSALDDEALTDLVSNAAESFGLEVNESDLAAIKAHANNSGRDALNYLERMQQQGSDTNNASPLNFLNGITDAVADNDKAAVVTLISERLASGEDADAIVRLLTEHFRNALVALQAPSTLNVNGDWGEAADYAAERLNTRIALSFVEAMLAANRQNSPNARIALEAALLEVMMHKGGVGGSQPAPASGISDKDLDSIVDEIEKRMTGVIVREVARALENVVPSRGHDPAVTDESSLDEASAEIAKPLPSAPREGDSDKDGDVGRAPFEEELFRNAMKAAMGRRGGILLDRHAELEVAPDKDDVLLFVVPNGRSLGDEDWDAVLGVATGLGWKLDEITRD